jgi:hypothetical protein
MFAWTKEQEQRHEVGPAAYLNSWAKLQEFPGRMVDWDADQVNQAYAEAVRKLNAVSSATRGLRRSPGELRTGGLPGRPLRHEPTPDAGRARCRARRPGFPAGRASIGPGVIISSGRGPGMMDGEHPVRGAGPRPVPQESPMPELRKDPIVGRWVIIAIDGPNGRTTSGTRSSRSPRPTRARSARGTRTRPRPRSWPAATGVRRPTAPAGGSGSSPTSIPALMIEGGLDKRARGSTTG